MEIISHSIRDISIVEIQAKGLVIAKAGDGLNLLGNVYYPGFDRMILYEKNITPDFFDLKNGMAGEILQKFSNYRMRLAIVGDFSAYQSKSIRDFMYESNQGRRINFVSTLEEAIKVLSS
jgi:hypothetical protein